MPLEPEGIELGVVVKPHGVRGVVKLRLYNPSSTTLQICESIRLRQHGEDRHVVFELQGKARGHVLLRIEGVSTLQQAEALRGARVMVDRGAVAPAQDGEYLYLDLLGCQVLDEQGAPLGEVHEVFEAGASDVLIVRHGELERLIPLVDAWILSVDLDHKEIVVRGGDQWEAQKI